MKHLITILSLLFLSACATAPPPTTSNSKDWQAFGHSIAQKGWRVQSKEDLVKASDNQAVSANEYQSYLTGYDKGQKEYCSQNAYMLGASGKIYNGICDQADPFFRQDYQSGQRSMGGI